MKNYIVQYGQSIYDVAINMYGDISKVWDIIDDNKFSNGLDTDLDGGQVLSIRQGDEMISNNISEYFVRYPETINNSDYEDTGIIATLQLILKGIGNEVNGGDGWITIDVTGGKSPYQFVWKNQNDDSIISNSQNLTAASSGTYSITVVDDEGNEASLANLVISVVDTNVYLTDEFGNFITDSEGNLIVVN